MPDDIILDLSQELLSQQAALQRLIARNADMPASSLLPHVDSGGPTPLQLPFIIIQVGGSDAVESLVFLHWQAQLMHWKGPNFCSVHLMFTQQPSSIFHSHCEWGLIKTSGTCCQALRYPEELLRTVNVNPLACQNSMGGTCACEAFSDMKTRALEKLQAGQEARVELQLSDDSTEVHFDFHG